MIRSTALSLIVVAASLAHVQAADPIVGNWLTPKGQTAAIAPCGGGRFCVTLKTGTYAGKQIGALTSTGVGYEGTVTDPANDKTYNGKATIVGSTLSMKGCVLGGLICRTQKWKRN